MTRFPGSCLIALAEKITCITNVFQSIVQNLISHYNELELYRIFRLPLLIAVLLRTPGGSSPQRPGPKNLGLVRESILSSIPYELAERAVSNDGCTGYTTTL
jgi:hypothetical protein